MKLLNKLWRSASARLSSLRRKAVWFSVWVKWIQIPRPRSPKEPEIQWASDIPLTLAFMRAEIRHSRMTEVLSRAPKHRKLDKGPPSLIHLWDAKPVIVEDWDSAAPESLDKIRRKLSKRKRYGNHPPNKLISLSAKG